MGKHSIFQGNNEVENFKNLEILPSDRDFLQFFSGDNFWYIHPSKLRFSPYVLDWEYWRKMKNQTTTKLGKNENSLIIQRLLLISLCNNFW